MFCCRIAIAVVPLILARSAQAQSVIAGDSEPCTYAKGALAISRQKHGGESLLIVSIGRSEPLGVTGGALIRSVTTVPDALAEARCGQEPRLVPKALRYSEFAAMGWMAVSREVTRKGPPVLANFVGFAEGAGRGLLIVAPAAIVSIPLDRASRRHFNRAVSLYNAQLPR